MCAAARRGTSSLIAGQKDFRDAGVGEASRGGFDAGATFSSWPERPFPYHSFFVAEDFFEVEAAGKVSTAIARREAAC
jgi:hypothetical protein